MDQDPASGSSSEKDQSVQNALDLLARHFGRKLEGEPSASKEASDLRLFYEKQLEVRDETIRSLRSLLSSMNAASVCRPAVIGSGRVEFERLIHTIEAGKHGFCPNFVNGRDWESQLDKYTQVVLSMLSAMSGIKIANVEARKEHVGGTVEYIALCSLEVGSFAAASVSAFQFTLQFHGDEIVLDGGADRRTDRYVRYEPIGWNGSNVSFDGAISQLSSPTVFQLDRLPSFVQDLLCKLVGNLQVDARQDVGRDVI
ncbi:hypothetical protein VNI00_017674 [Paramarasmius palmivorus]|uniref:Non-structural maintenance of chromosomes element 4 n=1 Tax=Paramarasmius palmivorus TaxID=297713 RepID=A0AAW0B3S6_9AGAR